MKHMGKRIVKIALCVLAGIIALLLVAIGVLNAVKFNIYPEYYDIKTDLCKNPGLGDGFICQGICADDPYDRILVSGYMKNHSASRVYVTDLDGKSYYVTLTKDGKAFTGHAGGIALYEDTVYIASGNALHIIPFHALTAASNGDSIEIVASIEVNNAASFVYADDLYIYVGEFHDGGDYVTDHPYETPDGTQYAIVSRYPHEDLSAPDKIYSIRNKVQGICFTPNGKIVMSTSYGLTDSVYYVYNEADAVDSGLTLDGAPVYYVNNYIKEIKGPAMAEGLDYYKGKVITLTESASNKYIFGKFFRANQIVSLDLDS